MANEELLKQLGHKGGPGSGRRRDSKKDDSSLPVSFDSNDKPHIAGNYLYREDDPKWKASGAVSGEERASSEAIRPLEAEHQKALEALDEEGKKDPYDPTKTWKPPSEGYQRARRNLSYAASKLSNAGNEHLQKFHRRIWETRNHPTY